jgi:regulator of nonsense transcripts 1
MTHILQPNPSKDDFGGWKFIVPPTVLNGPRRRKPGILYGKSIQFTSSAITFQMEEFKMNRILHSDDPNKFISLSFSSLRFSDSTLSDTAEYIYRNLQAGLWLNGTQYRFYHHSNSQLVGAYV